MTHCGQQYTKKDLKNPMKKETTFKITALVKLIPMLQLYKGKYLVGV